MVYGNMVDNDTEEWGKRARAATSSGIKKLQDSLGLAAQNKDSDGSIRPSQAVGKGGNR
jgi:hypothetical protein